MLEIIALGGLTALGFILVMSKIGIRKFVKFSWQSDLIITVVLGAIFVGTFSGMATGMIAGIFISLFLSGARWFTRIFSK